MVNACLLLPRHNKMKQLKRLVKAGSCPGESMQYSIQKQYTYPFPNVVQLSVLLNIDR